MTPRGIAAAAIARDDGDLRLAGEPRLRGRRFTIRQEAYWSPPFEIADDRAVALVALPRPIVDADDGGRGKRRTASPTNNPQKGVVAYRHHQPAGETRGRATAEGKSEAMDDSPGVRFAAPKAPGRPCRSVP